MATNAKGYAAPSAKAPLAPFSFQRRAVGADDVSIKILFCGVCHSDIHQARDEWGGSLFPMVPGHEIVGHVTSVGANVKKFKVGDTVGVGCMVDSCERCVECKRGLEQFCVEGTTSTYNSRARVSGEPTYGGYSDHIVVKESFVLLIPSNLDLAATAPLLCAGITTYSPLRHWGTKAGTRVGVVGLGGLGHMAVKIAKAMGAEVTVFTTSEGKREAARMLGADHVVISKDPGQMRAVKNTLNLIIDTVGNTHDLSPYILALTTDGVHILVGLPENPHPPVSPFLLLKGRKSIGASLIGGIPETQEMLDFCGRHGIVSDIELISIDYINTAYERVMKSDVRYRFVIDMATLGQ
ncbi:putative NADP-dependent alcohol hydrogenase [Trypanosoma cruzi]|uniref:NADP-dependent alcohol hydrogenase, putative n=3 Tax=Trypanosoma cruzi TaxID=5693 RepID=Q4DEF3_TRYCC|nr:NADP-dependent alcohol hydrogenase, putative [Trypanosoma cruzi]XP_816787.1 NADP-dependent alcohol hydrogenase, putative [Trypanosoma cruzi]EAN90903.1 NADP-dependent alcohol hydrogenase, putative [Trypanosoma cruzi]EAN94936.1 NADP-dependent alcohol hydrogenase, putative [Trypanosoma cruzi]PWV16768.1 putative NADP-dependent alcohol hydrogenase [Trypanosoma cruzi]RNC46633.1 putative NADP-dependent alcohol hydrogenase [Trypanosoma cruzi]|eukprot:XP_812754.1 NADP-dependent alcohol hydrogenase [Trypanosoma cruzi strain CL Brener]